MTSSAVTNRKGRSTVFESDSKYDGVKVTINHNGVSVFGYYDGCVGIGPLTLTLDQLEDALKNARRKR